MLPTMVKAALPKLHRSTDLPDLTLTRDDVAIESDHVSSYSSLCGFPRKDTVPLPYPHLLAFGLHLQIMADGSFPFPAIGTVHLENSITQHRPIARTERLGVTARPANLRPHAKGRAFDMLTEVRSGGELVWEETSTFLRRVSTSSTNETAGATFPDAPAHGIEWQLPADLGRKYAGISGDRDPIHLYPLTAKALGFPRQIAHGMWSSARCVGAIGEPTARPGHRGRRVQEADPAPGTVAFGSRPTHDGYAFSLSSPKSGAPHLAGRTGGLSRAVSATTGMIRSVFSSYSAKPGKRAAWAAYLSSRSSLASSSMTPALKSFASPSCTRTRRHRDARGT